ncbi:hypothetical protein C5S42_01995 [Candidatus Methanomarinus sp.]|nr:hypothetical protein C5S42_01995 [ANME-2 cluster archaeon]
MLTMTIEMICKINVTIQLYINVIDQLDSSIIVSYIHSLNHKKINGNKPSKKLRHVLAEK